MNLLRQLGWRGRDYAYAGSQQVRSLVHRDAPAHFTQGDAARPAIVLLPGVFETWFFLQPLAQRLNSLGFRVFSVPELAFNRMPIRRSAQIVEEALRQLQAAHGVDTFILLAHSKGGLIGKQLMLAATADPDDAIALHEPATSRAPAPLNIVGMVAVSTPFSGSTYARFMPSRILRDFSPRDEVVLDLLAQHDINTRIVSIYAAFDPHIPNTSALAGARNVELPIAGHFLPLRNPHLADAVEQATRELSDTTSTDTTSTGPR